MTDNKIYIDKVIAKFPSIEKTCRPAIALFSNNSVDSAINGFVVGNKYFITSETFKIYDKSAFYMINYLDEFDDDD